MGDEILTQHAGNVAAQVVGSTAPASVRAAACFNERRRVSDHRSLLSSLRGLISFDHRGTEGCIPRLFSVMP
jgi:hypothetical protein